MRCKTPTIRFDRDCWCSLRSTIWIHLMGFVYYSLWVHGTTCGLKASICLPCCYVLCSENFWQLPCQVPKINGMRKQPRLKWPNKLENCHHFQTSKCKHTRIPFAKEDKSNLQQGLQIHHSTLLLRYPWWSLHGVFPWSPSDEALTDSATKNMATNKYPLNRWFFSSKNVFSISRSDCMRWITCNFSSLLHCCPASQPWVLPWYRSVQSTSTVHWSYTRPGRRFIRYFCEKDTWETGLATLVAAPKPTKKLRPGHKRSQFVVWTQNMDHLRKGIVKHIWGVLK